MSAPRRQLISRLFSVGVVATIAEVGATSVSLANHDGHEMSHSSSPALLRLALARRGASNGNKTIARVLGISLSTVKAHVKAVMAKLNADSRTHAVSVAAQRGLVAIAKSPVFPHRTQRLPAEPQTIAS